LVLHLDLDSFFVAVERRARPELIGRPVVIGGRPGSHGMVAAASREARKCGIRVGMPLTHAAIRCPDGAFLDGAFDACFAASLQVDELLRRETPDVEWLSIDEAFVDLSPGARPRGAVDVAERLHRDIGMLGFDAACGIARSKLVAKIASRLARPSGVVHVLDGYEARFLSPLKIEMLPGIDPAVAVRLRAGGIRRLGQLAGPDACSPGRRRGLTAARSAGPRCRRHASTNTRSFPPPRIRPSRARPSAPSATVWDASFARAASTPARLRCVSGSPMAGSTRGHRGSPSRRRWTTRSWRPRRRCSHALRPATGRSGPPGCRARGSSPSRPLRRCFPSSTAIEIARRRVRVG
jgi:DNA polymerase-4